MTFKRRQSSENVCYSKTTRFIQKEKRMLNRLNIAGLGLIVLSALLAAACVPIAAPSTSPAATSAPAATTAPGTTELVVFAAASLTDAFQEIAQEFEASHPGVRIVYNFAGSQALSTQLIEGARADVFASANMTEMTKVQDAKLAGKAPEIFANNRLVVIVPADNPGKLSAPLDLAKPGIKLVIAEPSVPVGGYTVSMLEKMSADPDYGADFGAAALKNVVSQENNVKAIVAKVSLGEADAGVVYVSDVTPDVSARVQALSVPDEFNQIARYPIVVLTNAPNSALAQEFVNFVLSKDGGQKILDEWNFVPIK
jgi:molybdate transport system substrate-binding protein